MKRINKNKFYIAFAALLLIFTAVASELTAQHSGHEECTLHEEKMHTHSAVQSPAGIMGDHVHSKGSWMFSYMYMGMQMDEWIDGSSSANHAELHDQYEMLPDDMFMQMHMLGAMYAVTDRFTLMLMVPLLQKQMSHAMHGHHAHTMQSNGLGDVRLSVLTPLYAGNRQQLILNTGISIPTGSLNQQTASHLGMNVRMGYGMQNGTGTPDLHAALTFTENLATFSYGVQASGTLRIGENSAGYRHGNQLENSVWAGFSPVKRTSLTLRLQTIWQDSISGTDEMINPQLMPGASPDCYGGLKTRALAGMRYNLNSILPVNGSLGMEAGIPVYQNLNGPQMAEQWMVTGSLRISI